MRSENPTADQAEARLKADLRTALSRHGIRGAYAEKLRAEWQEHYASLCQEMSPTEALARLGSPEELAASAARTRFAEKFWCQHPVLFGSLTALGLFMLTAAVVYLPIIGIVYNTSALDDFVYVYVWSFNWLGAGSLILLAFWLSGRLSSPPRFRIVLLSIFSALILMMSMDFNSNLGLSEDWAVHSWAVHIILAWGKAPSFASSSQFAFWMLLMLRLGVFAYVIRSLRRRV